MRILVGTIALWLAFFSPAAAEKLVVATSFTIIADMAQNVAGDKADVYSIVKPGAEIHNYQPTPSDILRARKAKLVLWNGLGLEIWFEKFFANLKDAKSIIVSEGVEPISIHQGAYDGKPNPHAWMSPKAAFLYIDNIARALAAADPDNAGVYWKNAGLYKAEIGASIAPIYQKFSSLPSERRWLATSEGAFSYLARDFGLNELYLWPTNSDQQGTPGQVRQMIDAIRAHNVPVIFSESTISPKPAQQVAEECGIKYGGVLYVDSLGEPGSPVSSYLSLLNLTASRIAEGLEP